MRWRNSLVEPGLNLAVTLRYLATGDKYPTLQYSYRVSRSTMSLFVPEVCRAICEEYKNEVVQCPRTPQEWQAVVQLTSKLIGMCPMHVMLSMAST